MSPITRWIGGCSGCLPDAEIPSFRTEALTLPAPGDTGCSLIALSCSRTRAHPKQTALYKATPAPQGPPHPKLPVQEDKAWQLCLTWEQLPRRIPATSHPPPSNEMSALRLYHRLLFLCLYVHTVWFPETTNSPSIAHTNVSLRACFPGHKTQDNIYTQRVIWGGQRIKTIVIILI